MHIKPSDAVDLSADNMTNVHEEVKVIAKILRFFLFHKRMKKESLPFIEGADEKPNSLLY
jgi:hypothetical protein